MRKVEEWKPTKFVGNDEIGWCGSRDSRELGVGSRIAADLTAKAYAAAIARYAGGRLIDLGCGKVPLYGMYRSRVAEVTCVDWPNSLHGTSHVDQHVNLNEALPFDDSSFDTVICSDVLEHIWRHDVCWGELSRILAPGGHLILGTPFLYWVHEAPHDYFRWTPFSLRQACEDVGLDVIELVAIGGALEVMADVLAKLTAAKSAKAGAGVATLASWILRRKPVRALSRSTESRFALAHVLVAGKS